MLKHGRIHDHHYSCRCESLVCLNSSGVHGSHFHTGQYTKLEAVAGKVKNTTGAIKEKTPLPNWGVTRAPSEEHWVVLITSFDDRIYALDLTRAQHWWATTLTPWDESAGNRLEKHSEIIPLEHVREIWNQEHLPLGAHTLASSKLKTIFWFPCAKLDITMCSYAKVTT